jgi:hypothetical protein
MTSNYQPLANYLAVQSRDRVAFTFAQIEGLVGRTAPLAPGRLVRRRRPADGIVAALSAVGWQVEQVDVVKRAAVFIRQGRSAACKSSYYPGRGPGGSAMMETLGARASRPPAGQP